MSDREELAELVSRVGLHTDAREWDDVQALFCVQVDVDYTSLTGGEPQRLSPEEIVDGWRTNLTPLASTHHLIANHVVTVHGDEADVITNVTGTHVADDATGDRLWTVGGRYDVRAHRVDGRWRIAALTLTVRWATGNQAIMGGP